MVKRTFTLITTNTPSDRYANRPGLILPKYTHVAKDYTIKHTHTQAHAHTHNYLQLKTKHKIKKKQSKKEIQFGFNMLCAGNSWT